MPGTEVHKEPIWGDVRDCSLRGTENLSPIILKYENAFLKCKTVFFKCETVFFNCETDILIK